MLYFYHLFLAVDCVESEPLIAKNSECMKLVNDAKTYHLMSDWTTDGVSTELQPRSIHKEAKVYIIGGEVHQKVIEAANYLSHFHEMFFGTFCCFCNHL